MRIYAAPLEGITGYIWRRAQFACFGGIDRCYTPFIVPGQKDLLRSKAVQDVLPQHNTGIPTVPQILTNRADDFLNIARALAELGYTEINLNLGCPSGTVTAKYRGAGFLALPDELDRFLDTVCSASPLPVSVKTRIGCEDAAEAERLIEIYNRYPLTEITVHPRLMRQKYRGKPDYEAFARFVSDCRHPLCYNGDLFTASDLAPLCARFAGLTAVMLGRGLIADPALARRMRGGEPAENGEMRRFHALLLEGYRALEIGDTNVLYRMKEVWSYLHCSYEGAEQPYKVLLKSKRLTEYSAAAEQLLACPLRPDGSSYRGTP